MESTGNSWISHDRLGTPENIQSKEEVESGDFPSRTGISSLEYDRHERQICRRHESYHHYNQYEVRRSAQQRQSLEPFSAFIGATSFGCGHWSDFEVMTYLGPRKYHLSVSLCNIVIDAHLMT